MGKGLNDWYVPFDERKALDLARVQQGRVVLRYRPVSKLKCLLIAAIGLVITTVIVWLAVKV